MSKVWKEAPYHGNKLLCLLACADWANDDGEFYPSYNTIGKKIRITRRSAIRLLSSLVEDGAVSKIHRRNKSTHSSNLFKIHPESFPKIASLSESSKQECTVLGDRTVTAKRLGVVTVASLGSDSSVTKGSDSSVTHIHHVEPSHDTSPFVINPKADLSLVATVPVGATSTDDSGLGDGQPESDETVRVESSTTTPPEVAPAPPIKPQTDHQRMMDALQAITGQKILNGAAQGRAVKKILTAYTVTQAIEVLRWMADPNSRWIGKADWLSVQNFIGEYFRRQQQLPTKINGGNYYGNSLSNLTTNSDSKRQRPGERFFQ